MIALAPITTTVDALDFAPVLYAAIEAKYKSAEARIFRLSFFADLIDSGESRIFHDLSNAISVELNAEYAAMSGRRITGDSPLFAEVV